MIYYYDTIILLCSSQVQVDRDLIRSMNELLLQLKQCFLWQSLANAFISSSLKKLQLKRKTIMIYIRLIFVSPCKVIPTVVLHACWFNSHKDVDPLCVFLMKSCELWKSWTVLSLFSVTQSCVSLSPPGIYCGAALESMQECDESWVAPTLQVFTAQDCSSKSSFQQLWEKAGLTNTDTATRFRWLQLSVIGASSITVWNQCKGWSIVDCVCSKLHFPCFVADSENQRQPQRTVKHETRKPQISPNLAVTARTGRPSTPCTGTPLTPRTQWIALGLVSHS